MTLNDAHEVIKAHLLWLDGFTNEAVNLKRVKQAMRMVVAANENASMTLVKPKGAQC